jgi:hypothetical protein
MAEAAAAGTATTTLRRLIKIRHGETNAVYRPGSLLIMLPRMPLSLIDDSRSGLREPRYDENARFRSDALIRSVARNCPQRLIWGLSSRSTTPVPGTRGGALTDALSLLAEALTLKRLGRAPRGIRCERPCPIRGERLAAASAACSPRGMSLVCRRVR